MKSVYARRLSSLSKIITKIVLLFCCTVSFSFQAMELPHEEDAAKQEKLKQINKSLWQALRNRFTEAVKEALEKGADPHATWSLIPGMNEDQRQLSMRLNGFKVDLSNPLHYAAYFNLPLNILSLLITHGADISRLNYEQQTPLTVAFLNGSIEAVQFLISSGAQFHLESKEALESLKKSLTQCCLPTVIWFLNHIANTEDMVLSNEVVSTILTRLTPSLETLKDPKFKNSLEKLRILRELFKKFYLHNYCLQKMPQELTLLQYGVAVRAGLAEVVRRFLKPEFLKNYRTWKGNNLLHKAAAAGNRENMLMLLAEDSQTESDLVNRKNKKGRTPIFTALGHNHLELAQLLIEHGALTDTIKDEEDISLLEFAHLHQNRSAVIALLKAGTSVSSRTKALLVSIKQGFGDLIRIMLKSGALIPSLAEATKLLPSMPKFPLAAKNKLQELLISYGAFVDTTSREELDVVTRAISNWENGELSLKVYALYCAISTGRLRTVKRLLAAFKTPMNLLAIAYSAAIEAEKSSALTFEQKAVYASILHLVENHVLNCYRRQGWPGLSEKSSTPEAKEESNNEEQQYIPPILPNEIARRILYYGLLDVAPPSLT